jgi:hypothetical protein
MQQTHNEGVVRSDNCNSGSDRRQLGGLCLASSFPLIEPMLDDPEAALLARDMIDVHGAEAATVARGNARGAALAGQPAQAKSWIRVLGIIQRHQAGTTASARLRQP